MAQVVVYELEKLYDVPALVDGESIVKRGGALAAVQVAEADDLSAETAARIAGDTDEATSRDAAIATHAGDTTAVHGIADTAALETQTGAQTKADAAQTAAVADITALRGAANGYASLDSGGKIPAGQIPQIALSTTYVVGSEAEMLALAADPGDVAIRTDLSESFVLAAADPSVLSNWVELLTPAAPVSSVAGKTGNVTLDEGDIAGLTSDLDTLTTGLAAKETPAGAQAKADAAQAAAISTAEAYTDEGLAAKVDTSALDTDGTLATNSDAKLATQKAVKTYVDAHAGAAGAETVNVVAASGASVAIPDMDVATLHDVTLTANCTFTFPASGRGKSFSVLTRQDATGGRTITWPANIKWTNAGAVPAPTSTAGSHDIYAFVCFDGVNWEGAQVGIDNR